MNLRLYVLLGMLGISLVSAIVFHGQRVDATGVRTFDEETFDKVVNALENWRTNEDGVFIQWFGSPLDKDSFYKDGTPKTTLITGLPLAGYDTGYAYCSFPQYEFNPGGINEFVGSRYDDYINVLLHKSDITKYIENNPTPLPNGFGELMSIMRNKGYSKKGYYMLIERKFPITPENNAKYKPATQLRRVYAEIIHRGPSTIVKDPETGLYNRSNSAIACSPAVLRALGITAGVWEKNVPAPESEKVTASLVRRNDQIDAEYELQKTLLIMINKPN